MHRIAHILFLLVLAEVVLGGGGRLLEVGPFRFGEMSIGPFTMRMILFLAAMCLSVVAVFYRTPLPRFVPVWMASFVAVIGLALLVGTVQGSSIEAMAEDVRPLLAFALLPFFAIAIRDADDVRRVRRTVQIGAFVMAGCYIAFMGAYHAGFFSFAEAYAMTSAPGEFIWRNDQAFFYKGFIYLAVGFAFFLTSRGSFRYVGMAVILFAVILTLTRGFALSLGFVLIAYVMLLARWQGIALIVVATVAVVLAGGFYEGMSENWSDSDAARITQIEEVAEAATPVSLVLGRGFGQGVPSRPVHMEISLLEIVHKQGAIGLLFWMLLLIAQVRLFLLAKRNGRLAEAAPFLLAALVIYVQSLTNPYMNNPIGMTMVLASYVCLKALANEPSVRRRRIVRPVLEPEMVEAT